MHIPKQFILLRYNSEHFMFYLAALEHFHFETEFFNSFSCYSEQLIEQKAFRPTWGTFYKNYKSAFKNSGSGNRIISVSCMLCFHTLCKYTNIPMPIL